MRTVEKQRRKNRYDVTSREDSTDCQKTGHEEFWVSLRTDARLDNNLLMIKTVARFDRSNAVRTRTTVTSTAEILLSTRKLLST